MLHVNLLTWGVLFSNHVVNGKTIVQLKKDRSKKPGWTEDLKRGHIFMKGFMYLQTGRKKVYECTHPQFLHHAQTHNSLSLTHVHSLSIVCRYKFKASLSHTHTSMHIHRHTQTLAHTHTHILFLSHTPIICWQGHGDLGAYRWYIIGTTQQITDGVLAWEWFRKNIASQSQKHINTFFASKFENCSGLTAKTICSSKEQKLNYEWNIKTNSCICVNVTGK